MTRFGSRHHSEIRAQIAWKNASELSVEKGCDRPRDLRLFQLTNSTIWILRLTLKIIP